MASESWAVQQNVKVGNDLINLRADTSAEFQAIAEWVIENAALFVKVQAALGSVPPALAANVSSVQVHDEAPTPQNNGGWTATPPQQQAPQGQGAAPTCRHGQRVFKSGTSKAGKEYKLWACPSQNRQDQCEAQWVR